MEKTRDIQSGDVSCDASCDAAAARAGRTARIRAVAPTARAVGDDHVREVLRWLWTWRIIDHHVLGRLLDVSRSTSYRLLQRMRRRGVIRSLPVSGTPAHPWMLTPMGAAIIAPAIDAEDIVIAPVTSPDRIRVTQVAHDLLAQIFVLELQSPPPAIQRLIDRCRETTQADVPYPLPPLEVDLYAGTWFEVAANPIGKIKIPDAVIDYVVDRGSDARVRLTIEVQQTVETVAARARAVSAYCVALGAREIDAVIWCSTRPSIPPAYHATASPALRDWVRTQSRHWAPVPGPGPYRDWMSGRILQMPAPHLEAAYYHLALVDG